MNSTSYPHLLLEIHAEIAFITLNRPETRNAFNAELIHSITALFADLAQRDDIRAVTLRGAGPSFCAGGDLGWMKDSAGWTYEENIADATALADMYEQIDSFPGVVICAAHGHAFGGGIGLTAVSDIVLAETATLFSFSEVKLGLAPATIAPYVVAKIGGSHARALFLTGERFSAAKAKEIGLVHFIAGQDTIEHELQTILAAIRSNGPHAMRETKRLLRILAAEDRSAGRQNSIATIASLRAGPEGQEGLKAFFEKRRATWVVTEE